MQLVTDRSADLSAEQLVGLHIHFVPLIITLDGKSYRGGVDLQPDEFYKLLEKTDGLPITSQPAPNDFADLYRKLAVTDPDILSVHISTGLSGTLNAARLGAEMVPEANVSFVDTKTLSGAQGWQVEAAARGIQAGWSLESIKAMLQRISDATDTIYTLPTLKYLIHGGRISHLKGLLASTLNIKPLIGVEKVEGKYEQLAQVRTFNRAVQHIGKVIAQKHPEGSALRVQVMHTNNPEGAETLRKSLDGMFDCDWLPSSSVAPVLGAHTGPGLIGAVFANAKDFPDLPPAPNQNENTPAKPPSPGHF